MVYPISKVNAQPNPNFLPCVAQQEKKNFLGRIISHQEVLDYLSSVARDIRGLDKTATLLVPILQGAQYMTNILTGEPHNLGYPLQSVEVSSYDGTKSTGQLTFKGNFNPQVFSGKDVIFLDEIIESGTTAAGLLELAQQHGASSTQIYSLTQKPDALKQEYEWILPHLTTGFLVNKDHFLLGSGMDFNQKYRDLNGIYVFNG